MCHTRLIVPLGIKFRFIFFDLIYLYTRVPLVNLYEHKGSVYTDPLRAHFTDENRYRGVSDEPT